MIAQNRQKSSVRIGSLVLFKTNFDSWSRDYNDRNPGVVIDTRDYEIYGNPSKSATILWSNGSITSEHFGYLDPVDEDR